MFATVWFMAIFLFLFLSLNINYQYAVYLSLCTDFHLKINLIKQCPLLIWGGGSICVNTEYLNPFLYCVCLSLESRWVSCKHQMGDFESIHSLIDYIHLYFMQWLSVVFLLPLWYLLSSFSVGSFFFFTLSIFLCSRWFLLVCLEFYYFWWVCHDSQIVVSHTVYTNNEDRSSFHYK